jgi:hypothetical protein
LGDSTLIDLKERKKSTTLSEAVERAVVKTEVLTGLGYYAFVHKPDQGNAKRKIGPSYKIDLVLDGDQLTKAEKLGLNIKEATDRIPGPHVTIRSKVDTVKYPDRQPPRVMDSQKNPIPKTILVGNGSKVNVRFVPLQYGENDVTPILKDIQVVELVKYVPTPGELERKGQYLNTVEGGFVVDPNI